MKKRILLVDDEAEIREIFAAILESHDYEVETAQDGRSAFNLLTSQRFDLAVSDLRMPGMSGVELLKALRASSIAVPKVLFISGYTDIPTTELYELGCDGFLSKPFSVDELLETLNKLLEVPQGSVRRHSRHPVNGATSIDSGPTSATDSALVNISQGGLCVEASSGSLKIGDRVRLRVQIQDPVVMSLIAEAEVRWIRPKVDDLKKQSVGVQFIRLDPESERRLQTAMAEFEKSQKN